MSQPEIVTERLGGEEPVAEVDLGGDDRLLVTPSRTLIYRAEGLLSDETIEELSHDVECITVEKSRRKATIDLDYGIDGEDSLTVPKGKLDEVLHPMLAGVLDAHGITEAGESVKRTFRFSELTLVITGRRVVKHIGQPVWDEEYEEYPFEEVTDLAFEPGSVSVSVVLTLGDHQERFKAPDEQARMVEATVKDALLSYYDVPDIETLRDLAADEGTEEPPSADAEDDSPFGEGPELFGSEEESDEEPEPEDDSTDGIVEQVAGEEYGSSAAETLSEPETTPADADLAAEITELREAVESQRAELERQSELIDRLIEELRAGR